jgi:flavin reductase (DIM6/NTAB) family NADH-FMN oxidoreductase RutF
MSFESADFRATMAHFATGVTVVTTRLGQACFGLTVNAFSSISLHPPLILVSLDLKSQTYTMIRQSGIFAVNILAKGQQQLAMRFASKDLQRKTFDDIPLTVGETNAPLFQEALAWIECRVAQEYAGGDHVLVLGEVLNIEYHGEQHEPLLYYRSSFWAIQQTEAPSGQAVSGGKVVSGHGEEGKPVVAASTLLLKELLPAAHLFSFEA